MKMYTPLSPDQMRALGNHELLEHLLSIVAEQNSGGGTSNQQEGLERDLGVAKALLLDRMHKDFVTEGYVKLLLGFSRHDITTLPDKYLGENGRKLREHIEKHPTYEFSRISIIGPENLAQITEAKFIKLFDSACAIVLKSAQMTEADIEDLRTRARSIDSPAA